MLVGCIALGIVALLSAGVFLGANLIGRILSPAPEVVPEETGGPVGPSNEGSIEPEKTMLTFDFSQVDNEKYPEVVLYVKAFDPDNDPVDLDGSQLQVVETDERGEEHPGEIKECALLSAGEQLSMNLVIDQSGSMGEFGKMENAKAAARTFVNEIRKNESNSAEITAFESQVSNRQPFTTNDVLLNSAIASLEPSGQTAFYDALYWALQRTSLKGGSRVVIAFTDGVENASRYSEQEVIDLSAQTGIPVYVIGVGDEVEARSLEVLSRSCGGAYYRAETENLALRLEEIYAAIYENQRSMYRILFTSKCTGTTSAYRQIKVTPTDESPYEGTAERRYVPVDSVDPFATSVNMKDYVIPESSSRALSRYELENYSLWELYLARNEIFARHGRGFKNQDLVEYFATRSWYRELYSPDEFSALSNQLNGYELKNVETMLAIERERNSPYLVTAGE